MKEFAWKWMMALVPALGFLVSGAASADPIGPNCPSCDGGIYTLFYSGLAEPDADPLHETFRITFKLDTTGVAAAIPGAVALDAASIKIATNATTVSLFGAPGGTSDWNLVAGGVNASGCSGSGNGFDCADWNGPAGTIGTSIGGILYFIFDETFATGAFTGTSSASIKARYVNAQGNKVGALLSEDIALQTVSSSSGQPDTSSGGPQTVPEPSSGILSLLGVVLLGGTMLWRRRALRS